MSRRAHLYDGAGRPKVRDGAEVVGRQLTGDDEHAARPEEDPRGQGDPRDPAVPRRRGAEGVPRAGRVDPRQARRGDRPPDAATGRRVRAGRLAVPPGREGRRPRSTPRPTAASSRTASSPPRVARAHGDHEGVARDRLVAVRRFVPGDDPGAHRGGHRGQDRRPVRAQGERDHREAHPGWHRHAGLPGDHDQGARLRAAALLLDRHRRRGHGRVPARLDRQGHADRSTGHRGSAAAIEALQHAHRRRGRPSSKGPEPTSTRGDRRSRVSGRRIAAE